MKKVVNCFVFHSKALGIKHRKLKKSQKPFFGKIAKLTGSVNSLDGKWHVNFYDVTYYFLGVEIFSSTIEKVISDSQSN